MKAKILQKAKEDIPLYFKEFRDYWNKSTDNICDDDLFEIYRASIIFKNWKLSFHSLKNYNYDKSLEEIHEDINSSLFLALLGLYRSAHMHMRSSIELSMQLIYFLDHPIEYKFWNDGNFVIKHNDLAEYIIKHPRFDIDIRDIVELITKDWKKFSKHIHGESPVFFQCETENRKTTNFSKKHFGIWKGNYLRNIYNLNKLFLFFFKKDLNRFPQISRDILLGDYPFFVKVHYSLHDFL